MNKNYKKNFYLLRGIITLGLLLFSSMEKLEAQEVMSSAALTVAPTNNLPDQEFSLELIPLEGNHVNPEKCQETDAQSIHLLPGQKLVVTLYKKLLFYDEEKGATLGCDYGIQSDMKVNDWGSWDKWVLGCAPLDWKSSNSYGFYNNYCYQAGNGSGKVTLSFISETYPRYYASLQVIIE